MSIHNHPKVVENVSQLIAPAWPLKNFVAVNPYVGLTNKEYPEAAKLMASRGAIKMTMSIKYYLDQFQKGKISRQDLQSVLDKSEIKIFSIDSFLKKAQNLCEAVESSKNTNYNLIDVATNLEGIDWKDLMVDRVSFWAAALFDEHVSVWNKQKKQSELFRSWKIESQIDRTPEIMGLSGFRSSIKKLPDDYQTFINNFLSDLKLDKEDTEAYLHSLLLKVMGWSSFISGMDFHNKLYEGNNSNLIEFLAILLSWENYFLNHSKRKEEIRAIWYKDWYSGEPINSLQNESLEIALLFQEALDRTSQRILKQQFTQHKVEDLAQKIKAQMIFCIDVRSEVYRRNLEMVNQSVETIGFAGFFGFPIKYIPLGYEQSKNQCPVLIPSSALVKETSEKKVKASSNRISKHQIAKTWKKFKSGAITSFGFVSPLGLSFLPKILLDSFQITERIKDSNKNKKNKYLFQNRSLDLSAINLDEKVTMAAAALTGMGIKDQLAPLVLIAGHGSSSLNNPHASGLDCGACGGHSGEVNALTAQYIFNDPEVRNKLREKGIHIPNSTLFLACLHDTTTDEIHFIKDNSIPETHKKQLHEIKQSLQIASKKTRLERSLRLNIDINSDSLIDSKIKSRAQDWSQIRPEWGLAGCHSFIVAQRKHSRGLKLDGKSFLHNYNWNSDNGYKILETIITAPMVVTSWINLQYFASTTDNKHYGAGNKTLHNIVSGIGVLEGSSGDLRIGLPLQSIHNGQNFEHIPIRLNVVIEAPIDAINNILEKHKNIQQMFDNKWIYLHRMNENGTISHTYTKNLNWISDEKESNKPRKTVLGTL
jgi:uncharacterized protein YbcC (UPF0753/DUF2309 family)